MKSILFHSGILGLLFPLFVSAQTISGEVVMPNALPIRGVLVTLYDDQGVQLDQDLTGTDGSFAFDGLTTGQDYHLTFTKGGANLNGVSTFDVVIAAKHILGIDEMSPYATWAGDVNGGATTTTFDLVLIRQLILGLENQFAVPNWLFGPADGTGPVSELPVTNLTGTLDLEVIGVKSGDVSFSADPCQ